MTAVPDLTVVAAYFENKWLRRFMDEALAAIENVAVGAWRKWPSWVTVVIVLALASSL